MRFATELQEVCGRLDRRDITRDAFVAACTRLTTAHVGCSRAGIWTFLDAAGGPLQHCLGVYDAIGDRMVSVPEFSFGLEAFIDALQRDGHALADDASTHPATTGWWHGKLRELDVTSLMAASFSINGQLFGAFTCAQVGQPMHWTSRQLSILKRVAVRASLSLASATSFTLTTLPAPLLEIPPLTTSYPADQ